MRKLTICFVSNNYKPYAGGVVASIEALAKELRLRGHKVIIVSLDFEGTPEKESDVVRIKCFWRFFYKKNPIAVPIFSKIQLEQIFSLYKPKIVHVHHPFLLGHSAMRVARSRNIPIVFTYHTVYSHQLHYIPFPKAFSRFVVDGILAKFCDAVDHIIIPSGSIKKFLPIESLKKETKVSVIPSAISPVFVTKKFPDKSDLSPDRLIRLLTVSRFVPEKNIIKLLNVFSTLESKFPGKFDLTLVGYGFFQDSLKKHAYNKLGLSKKAVRFIEKQEKSDLVNYYKSADLFLFASKSETQGLVLMEAMSQATPIIAFKAPGVVDFIKDNYNGFLVVSEAEMSSCIERIVLKEKTLSKLQKSAYKTSKEFIPEIIAEKISKLYNKLVAT